MAYDFLKANARKIGIDRDLSSYNVNIQVISLMQGKDAQDLGVAFFVGQFPPFYPEPQQPVLLYWEK
ncbi:MAG: hypothetical protein ACOWYE_15195 [Desulfatiglandales bacterium]